MLLADFVQNSGGNIQNGFTSYICHKSRNVLCLLKSPIQITTFAKRFSLCDDNSTYLKNISDEREAAI